MLVLAGAIFGFSIHVAGLLVLAVLLGLLRVMMASFPTAFALTTEDISAFPAVINGINLPVLLLAGVPVPIALGPEWLRVVGHLDPPYYLVVASRHLAAGGLGAPATWQAFAVIAPLTAVSSWWATSVFREAVSYSNGRGAIDGRRRRAALPTSPGFDQSRVGLAARGHGVLSTSILPAAVASRTC